METVISILVVIVLAAFCALLTTRTWKVKRPLVKWPGSVLAGLFTIAFTVVGVAAGIGYYRLHMPVSRPVPEVLVTRTPEQLARGERLANLCATCHSTTQNLPLDGGEENFVEGIGTLYAPNLTPGGPLKDWSDAEIVRAIREGVGSDGRPLLLMPAETFRHVSDADAQAIVAYLRSQPAAQRQTPATSMNLIGTVVIGLGVFPTAVQPPIAQPVAPPANGVNVEHGEYLVEISGCRNCHGADLAGGPPGDFGPPPGPNLTVLVPNWTDAQFVQTMRTGTDPTGHKLNPDLMPLAVLLGRLHRRRAQGHVRVSPRVADNATHRLVISCQRRDAIGRQNVAGQSRPSTNACTFAYHKVRMVVSMQ